jgi:diacylglycerol kinase (ATP)
VKIHVIVNPNAGRRIIQNNLELIVGKLLMDGTASAIKVTRTQKKDDALNAAASCTKENTDLIIGCGGDGTISEVINGIMRSGNGVPLAILAAGTSNDFAVSLRLPDDPDKFCEMVQGGCYRNIDVGLANDSTYFLNVVAFGIFTDISHNTSRDAKNILGRLAYYLHAASSVPEQFLKSAHLDITMDSGTISGDFLLSLVTNSTSVGMFRKLMHQADVSDGLLDVLLLEKRSIFATASAAPNKNKAFDFFKSPAIQYFQTSKISFESPDNKTIEVDSDGEYFGSLPLHLAVCPQAIRLLVPAKRETRPQLNGTAGSGKS